VTREAGLSGERGGTTNGESEADEVRKDGDGGKWGRESGRPGW